MNQEKMKSNCKKPCRRYILMRYITIALAKGRLAKKAMEIFEQIGIPCEEMKDEKTRKLIFTNEELGSVSFYQSHLMFLHM